MLTSAFHPEGAIEDFHGAIVWTEMDAQDAYPGSLIINTKAARRTLHTPRLLSLFGNSVLLSALDKDASGSGLAPTLLHILLREYDPT